MALVPLLAMTATAAAQQTVLPRGLQTHDGVSGIYPGDTQGDCCWLSDKGAIRITRPADAKALLLNVFIPPFALGKAPQRLFVQIGSDRAQITAPLSVGEHELVFTLPQKPLPRQLDVRVMPSYTFVPALVGINQDPRRLSVLIRAIGFATPDGYEDGAPLMQPALLPRPAAYALLALLGFIILLATLRRPAYGLCALILTDPFLLTAYFHGTTLTLPKVALVAVALGIVPRLVRSKGMPPDRALIILLVAQAALIATMALSSIHAHSHAAALRETLKAMQYAATLLVAYVAFRLDPDERTIRVSIIVLAFAVLVPALVQVRMNAQEWETVHGITVPRIAGPLGGPNQLAGFLGIIVPMMAAFWSLRRRVAAETLAILIGTTACLLTFSRGGVVSLIVALAVIATVHFARVPRKAIAVTCGVYVIASVLAFLVFVGAAPHAVAAAFGASESHEFNGGLGNRFDLWHDAYAIWKTHPLIGAGPGNYELMIGDYTPGLRTHANGMLFQTLAEQGALGLLAFIAVTIASVGVFLRKLNNPFALGAAGASIALAFHQIVDCMVIYPKVGVIWWIVLGVAAASIGNHD